MTVPSTSNDVASYARGALPSDLGRFIRSLLHRREDGDTVLPVEGLLPDFDGASGWLNAAPLTAAGLHGRVVLVNFWTYTCINWLRTLPYVRAWEAKYRDQGLTVVGVHTPEFGFEHERDNVTTLVHDLGVTYPVALDNDYAIWRAFSNHFWPAIYIADAHGRLRYHHFGEREYAMTEMAIQELLVDAGADGIEGDLVQVTADGFEADADWANLRSPETYLGYSRTTGFASPDPLRFDAVHDYAEVNALRLNRWAPVGNWVLASHAAVLHQSGGRVVYRFHARDVHLVMGPLERGRTIPFRVRIDAEPPGDSHGLDVDETGSGSVTQQRLYQLIRQRGPITERLFEIEFLEPGVEAYCFTFG